MNRARLAALLLGLLLAVSTAPVSTALAETVRIARQFGISYLPLIVMQDRHLLEEEGKARGVDLTPEWTTFTGGPPINDALISGSIDLAAGGVGPMLTLWGRTGTTLRVKALAALNNMPLWLNTSNPAVKSVADFGPRDRIALPGVKVSIQAVILQMAARQAFGPGQEFRLDPLTVTMGHPDGQAALMGGGSTVTAHFTAAPFMYEELESPRIHLVLNSYDVLGGPHSFNLVWTTTRYYESRPQVIAAFMAALERAMKMIAENPLDAAGSWVRIEHTRLTAEQAAEIIRRPENQWTTTPTRIMQFMRFMHETGALPQVASDWRDVFFPLIHGTEGS